MELINHLNWRYATKKFDSSKKVSNANLDKLMESVRLSASSFGLQPYKVLVIEDSAVKEKLKAAAWGQEQVVDASHVFIFCNYSSLKDEHVDELFDLKSAAFGKDKSEFAPYISFIKEKVGEKSTQIQSLWNARQAYIGMANLLVGCAELKIDACPMEGFDPAMVNEILGLESKGLEAVVMTTVGYRSADDITQHFPKVRKPKEQLFEIV